MSLASIKVTLSGKPRSLNAPFTQSDLAVFPAPAPLRSHAHLCTRLSLVFTLLLFFPGTNSFSYVFVLGCVITPFVTLSKHQEPSAGGETGRGRAFIPTVY